MSTSLSEQLQRLKTPQIASLADARQRASVLFDSKEAATKDRRTIFELGFSGLQELTAINPNFQQFELTLFNEATLHMERAVEHKDVNDLLDRNISKFLQHLSPYFLLRPAHMCLEWLLRRFQVNEYNRDALMALALPYHETNAFVRVVQTFRLKKSDKDWNWLRSIKKPGRPLSKGAILNHAATDRAFLRFVCKSTLDAVTELGPQAHILQTQLNFYCSVVVGALENAASIQEWHIATLLPSLLKGLGSEVIDFVSAAFIITARLVARTQVTPKLCNAIIGRIASVSFDRLQRPAALLLICIFDTQHTAKPHISEDSVLKVINQKWMTLVLAGLAKENVDISPLCVALLSVCVAGIQKGHEESEAFRDFLGRLLDDIQFPNTTAQELISSFLDSFVDTTESPAAADIQNGDVIELDFDDDDMMPSKHNFYTWYSQYLQRLERQYPAAFDATIKKTLSSQSLKESSNRSKALKLALGYRLKTWNESSFDIYENLYHHTAAIRLIAIRTLMSNLTNYKLKPQNYQILKECLADRISDDSEEIVAEVLKLPTHDIIEVTGCTEFVEALCRILHKIQTEPNQWAPLGPQVVKHLTAQEVVDEYDTNLILLALMPLLFPNENNRTTVAVISAIVRSPLTQKIRFLKNLEENVREEEFHTSAFKKHFLNAISRTKETPSALELLASVEKQGTDYFKDATQLYYFLILVTACLKEKCSGEQSLKIFRQICGYSARFKIKDLESHQWKVINMLRYIPLQLFSDFLFTLTTYTSLDNLRQSGWAQSTCAELDYFLTVFDKVTQEVFEQEKGTAEQAEWSKVLKEMFDVVFEKIEAKANFLCNFYLYSEYPNLENYPVLRIRAFKLLQVLLLNNTRYKVKFNVKQLLKICIALSSPSEATRLEALQTLELLQADSHSLEGSDMKLFVKSILKHRNEIGMDHDQFPLVLYTILKSENRRRQKELMGRKMLAEIVDLLVADKTLDHAVFTTELLKILKHVNDETILGSLLPLAASTLQKYSSDGAVNLLSDPYCTILRLIIERFDFQTVENVLLDQADAWPLFEQIFENSNVFVASAGKLKPVPCVLLESLDEATFEKMPSKYRTQFLMLLVRTLAKAENDTIFLTANKLLKRCCINCEPLVAVITRMCSSSSTPKAKARNSIAKRDTAASAPVAQINTVAWKEGVALLELLENKQKLIHSDQLIPPLFELLSCCLSIEEQTTVEYAKQLTLSALLHCCHKAREDGCDLPKALPKTTFRMDQIVQCLRASQNPQTHHNALILLSYCAQLYPQHVLHNIVDIFTFMGSSVVRHDDAFSSHIINDIIVSIVPILVTDETAVVPVLKVFSDIMLDVPEHRRLPLYSKLLLTLGAEKYLWMFLCVVFEAHVIDDEKQRLLQKKSTKPPSTNDQVAKRIEIALELATSFTPQIVMETCSRLMKYIKQLPLNKEEQLPAKKLSSGTDRTEATLFDVACHSAKQLRHYKYVIMQFLSAVSGSVEFLRKIALFTDEELLTMKPFYEDFITKILSYVPVVNAAIEQTADTSQTKFWKVISHHLHDVLDNAISLLSPDMFLVVVNGLMQHPLLSIRKKVIELLISKLQQNYSFFGTCESKNFRNLLQPLAAIIDGILEKDIERDVSAEPTAGHNELVFVQQTALIAIKLLSKVVALQHIEDFKAILVTLTKITKQRANISKILLATVVLTMIEISWNLKAHCLAQLHKFMPRLIDVLQDQAELVRHHPADNVCIAIVTGMQKLLEALPLFLGPYIVDIIASLSSICTRITAQHNDKDQRSASALQKITAIWTKIGTELPVRVLVPSCGKAYEKLMASDSYADVSVLMKLLHQSISHNTNEQLSTVHAELRAIFLQALEFRLQLRDSKCDAQCIGSTESSIIDAFVAWVLKLSESSFRPLYHELYTWALKHTAQKETILTYFLLSSKIAESLKSLFVLFAGDFIEDAATLLNECNTTKKAIEPEHEHIDTELLKAILTTFYNIFLHDSKEFVNTQRFEVLMQPIVDQLENRLVLEDESMRQLLSMCIAQLAVDVSNDVLWKQLNYQVLLKTRTGTPEVRIFAFKCCVEIARKLGDDFTPLLPETIPFIAELFEDENPRVEKNTRKSVQELEAILGESLQKYL